MTAAILRFRCQLRRAWCIREIMSDVWSGTLIDTGVPVERVADDPRWRVEMLVNDRRRALPVVAIALPRSNGRTA